MENPAKLREYLERLTLDLRKAHRRIEDLEQQGGEPIAIVGMACRYPGGVASPDQLWELVAEGRDGISEFPTDRGWDLERLYDPDPEASSERTTTYTREGGFVHDAAEFDAAFFEISPREALDTDPQQRLLLEASWQALEDAGIDPQALYETQTGVFAGAMYQDYGPVPGMTQSLVSGHVAYSLGLEGPAVTVDTACSSSLVAMHQAAQALRSGECSLALAGGATVLATPSVFIGFARQGGLAPDGRSKSFAEAADGVGWSEGVGVLVLERLSEARRNGHPILAVLRGSAVNQDGASNGFTAPNGPSQERVIRQALADAELRTQDVDVVEAHGTGTTLGDPIEAGALLATYGKDRDNGPLRLGSIKSNIGHTQAAAGVAGVIKMVQAMRHGVLPRTLHVDAPSSKVDWEAGEIELLTEEAPWEANGRPRRAGVSSFGISGTNAHVILEEAPEPEPVEAAEDVEQPNPALPGTLALPLSAKSEPALRESAANLATHLEENSDLDPADVGFSLTTRALLEHRAVALTADREELVSVLLAIASGEAQASAVTGVAQEGRLAYLFTGQGAQRPGMGKELYEASPVFAQALDEACEAFDPHLDRPLKELLFAKEGSPQAALLDQTTFTQPALFAMQLALFHLLESLGLRPDYLTGHSIGELSAAHLSGVLSLKDAAKLIAARGALMGELPQGGAMIAIEATEAEVKEALEGKEQELSIAAINGPSSVVISGTEQAALELQADFDKRGQRTKRLSVSHAFHSPLIEPMLEPFAEIARSLDYQEPRIPIVSTLTGELLSKDEATDPAYWVAQARGAVRFADAIASLDAQGTATYLELGPEAVLTAMATACLDEGSPSALIATLRSGRKEQEAIATAIASAHVSGAKLDLTRLYPNAKRVALPTYPFQRERYWLTAGAGAGDLGAAGLADLDHPLLAAAIEDPEGGMLLTGRISLQSHPWLADHAVLGTAILPGTAFVELALKAAEQVGAESVAELTLQAPLTLAEATAVDLQVTVSAPDQQGNRPISIHSRTDQAEAEAGEWTLHATGNLSPQAQPTPEPLTAWPPEGAERIDSDGLYERLVEIGFDYGPAFQGLTAAWQKDEEIYAEVSLAEAQRAEAGRFVIHPALLDSSFHAALGIALSGVKGSPTLPFDWHAVSSISPGASSLRVRVSVQGERLVVLCADATGMPVAQIGSLYGRPIDKGQLAAKQGSLYRLDWKALDSDSPAEAPTLAILGEEIDGIDVERHPDLEALVDACAESEAPEAILIDARSWGAQQGPVEASHAAAAKALQSAQALLAQESLAGARLIFLTEGALNPTDQEQPSLPAATLAGLLRSAQSEHPGRFALVDTDGDEASGQALESALAACAEEPQIAIREGELLAARLAPAPAAEQETEQLCLDPDKTVLITGGTSGLGALFARHLAEAHGARNLLLVSRSGPKAEGAKELEQELSELGAKVTIAACDVSDKDQLEQLIASIGDKHPLGAVIHAAGALANGLIADLDRERLDYVLAPKADAAHHLHELSEGIDLDAFVLFSSSAGLLGGSGQANYAAANSFLDALAAARRAQGLPATSLAWGLWAQESNLAGEISEAELERVLRQTRMQLGFAPMPPEAGLELFEQATALTDPLLAPVHFDRAALRAQAKQGSLPALLRGLVRVPKGRQRSGESLANRLATIPEAQHEAFVLGLVRSEVAAVLGHDSATAIEPERAFRELGLDSLAAVEIRNRLVAATDLQLPATLVFDYPNAAKLAQYLLAEVSASGAAPKMPVRAQASEEPIAIVGMACRYPGGASSPEKFWELVVEERDVVEGFPTDRGWGDLERLYDPDPDSLGTSCAREAGFLHEVGDFDAEFFNISPRDALEIDPQPRLFLEASWQALEDAGVDPGALKETQTGVFAGVMYQDYGKSAGMAGSVVAGRVSYFLGLEGPAVTVDTACSSSMVALHLAAQALRQGECSLALAGGVTVMSTPGMLIHFTGQHALAPDGRSKSFSDAANGTGLSEGLGVLTLERLSDAKRNGHPVLAVLKGSAVNQDGASNGFTAPNGPSQERVIRQALANARLEAKDVDAVEAHGTGTSLGDPIEAGALLATYGQDRDEPLKLGSIKSNIGHAMAAAGVAGVIKMVQAMRHGVLPRTLHVDKPSTHVDWEAGEIELLTEPAQWEPNGRPRRAGVSSFGASGTNAHVILEEAPATEPAEATEEAEQPNSPLPGTLALPLSAKSEAALREAAANLATHLEDNPELELSDVGYSLTTTRALFEQRAVALGSDREQLLDALAAIAEGQPSPRALQGKAASGRLAYLFTGQGAQRPGMGKELYEASPVFAAALDEACEALDPHLERSLRELLFATEDSPEAALLDQTTFTQPALFAIELALFRLLESLGLTPDYLVGHSIGELSAAHLSGVLSLKDAAKLIAARGALMGELPEGGAMIAIEATEAEVKEALEGKEQELSIAAINGPTSVVISGAEQAALQVQADFDKRDHRTKRLSVSHAFHSPLIEPMLAPFAEVAKSLDYQEPRIPIISTLTGELLTNEQATDPAYWVSQVRGTVRFADAIASLDAQGAATYLELGPDGVLTAMAASCLKEDSPSTLIATLRSGRAEQEAIATAIASAHVSGAKLELARLYPNAKRVALPTYPFQRERYWVQRDRYWAAADGPTDASAIGQAEVDHPLLGAAIEDPEGGMLLTGRISLQSHPWLADHAVLGTVILPGTAFVELALKAAEQVGAQSVAELTLQAPMVLAESGAVDLQVAVSGPDEQGNRPISIHSRTDQVEAEAGEWTLHATGALSPQAQATPEPLTAWPPEGAEPIDATDLYERLTEIGFDYGPAFQGLQAAWSKGEEVYAEVSLPEERRAEAGRFAIHPALLDSSFHAAMALALSAAKGQGSPTLPFDWHEVRAIAPGASSLRVRLQMQEGRLGVLCADSTGTPVAQIGSLYGRPIDKGQLAASQGSLYRLDWQALDSDSPAEAPTLAILGEAEIEGLEATLHPDFEALVDACTEGEPPEALLIDARSWQAQGDSVEASHTAAAKALHAVQALLAQEQLPATRLVLLTEGALNPTAEEEPNLPAATIAGLLRSAQSEHPGRFALIDTDGDEASTQALPSALAAGAEEPQIAIREGELLAARLAPAPAAEQEAEQLFIDPDKTVLITGGTSGLGALFAKHLAAAHGARNLLLVSRSGPKAEGAKELKQELKELGAKATIAACDVSDKDQLEQLLASIPDQHPLGAVIHAAGALDNGLIADLDRERLDYVLAPKADAAHHLHELSADLDLDAFVLFSSSAGLLGGPGQGNYAAANAFLDALAAKRQAIGLPATSLAWGLWAQGSNLAGVEISEAEIERVLRQTRMQLGFAPMPPEAGLELFEQATALTDPLLAPVHFDRAALRAQAKQGSLPALLRGLVRVPKGRGRSGETLATRLGVIPEAKREAFVLDFVRGHVAAVLGYDSAAAVDSKRAFNELGFDSLAAVELRNRLVAATDMQLPATMAFDYPSASALAGYLAAEVTAGNGDGRAVDAGETAFKEALGRVPISRFREAGLLETLMEFVGIAGNSTESLGGDALDEIDAMDVESMVQRTLERQGLESNGVKE